MLTIWKCGRVAVTGEAIDFADPAETGPDVRERGLRLEIRQPWPEVTHDERGLAPVPSGS